MARTADPNLKQSILSAARDVFHERGYADARMSDIAARAGVAVGSIYLHFKTKEALVIAICNEMYREVLALIEPCLRRSDAIEAMEAAMRAGLRFYEQERDFIQLLYLGVGLREIVDAWEGYEDPIAHMLAGFLRERMATGQIRRYDPDKLAVLIFGMVDQAAMHTIVFGVGDIQDYAPTLMHMLRNLLAPEAKPVRKTTLRRAAKRVPARKRPASAKRN